MMRKSKTITIGDREITVRELTVEQVDKLLGDFNQKRSPHPVELLLNASLPVEVVEQATGMTGNELAGDLTPSELDAIWKAVAEVNDFLSNLLIRLGGIEVGKALTESTENSCAPASAS